MADNKKKSVSKTEEDEDMKVLRYLKNQLKLMKEQLRSFELPLDQNTIQDIRKVEELILKNKIWMLESQIDAIEMILEK